MKTIVVKNKEYTIKYGFNAFADTDLLDRVNDIMTLFNENEVHNDSDVSQIGKIRDLFVLTRELIYVGFKKKNPIASVEEVGDLLDDYFDECPEGESRGILDIFAMLSNELAEQGFLADLMTRLQTVEESDIKSFPSDHKKKTTTKK